MMESPPINDVFEVTWNEKQYTCKKMRLGDSIVFVVEFTQRPLYLSRSVDVKGEGFWVSIPPDTKLSHVVLALGKQIDQHYKQ